MFPTRKRKK